jgi:hypothetical protein
MNFLRWLFAESKKEICEEHDVYSIILDLQERIEILEAENIETTNTLYEIMNSIEAVDRRIDILADNPWENQFNV